MSDQSRANTVPRRDRAYPPGYGPVEPVANYRPWDVDEEFRRIHDLVRDHTMVDVYRLWTLWYLADRIPPGDVLEVGSWRGGSGAMIGRAIAGGPQRRLYLADTYAGVVKAGPRDTYYRGGEHANTSPRIVEELLARCGVIGAELLVGVFPEETGERISDRSFALCHIDVDVYRSARDAFDWVWPRMVRGGLVVFDDYGFYGCEGVTACVEELRREGALVIPSLSGQAVLTRVEG